MIVDVYAGSYKYIELPCILECKSSLEASPSLEMVNLNVESVGTKHVCMSACVSKTCEASHGCTNQGCGSPLVYVSAKSEDLGGSHV